MKHLIFSVVLVGAVGCSENPLDPDEEGEIKTNLDELGGVVPPTGGGGGGGGSSGPTCDDACGKIAECFPGQIDYDACVTNCQQNYTAENRQFIEDASCQQIADALNGGG